MTLQSLPGIPDYRKAKLLIVDDSARHGTSLGELLRLQHYVHVDVITDPRQVVPLQVTNDYDLILLDLHMPEIDGFAVIEALKKNRSDDYLPVLVITAYSSMKHQALGVGALDVLLKPYNIDEMALRVRNNVHVRLLYKEIVRQAEDHRKMALYDPLTGLPNRRLLLDRTETALQYAKRNGKYMAVLYIDLDGFKAVNDRFGHAYGDMLLELVAKRLSEGARQADTAGRLGGDEFVVILSEVAAVEDASVPASKIIQSLSVPFIVNDQVLHISASVGIAVYPHHGETAEELMDRADTALYKVKRQGKNGYHFAHRVDDITTDSCPSRQQGPT